MIRIDELEAPWGKWQIQLELLNQLTSGCVALLFYTQEGKLQLKLHAGEQYNCTSPHQYQADKFDLIDSMSDAALATLRQGLQADGYALLCRQTIPTEKTTNPTSKHFFYSRPFSCPNGERAGVICLYGDSLSASGVQSRQLLEMCCDNIEFELGALCRRHYENTYSAVDEVQNTLSVSLQQFVDSFNEHIWLKDSAGRYVLSNLSVEKAWGKGRSDIVGKTDFELFDKHNAHSYVSTDLQAINNGKPIVVGECRSDENDDVWLETLKTPVVDAQGTLLGVTGMTRNISSQKVALEQLSLASKVLENACEGVIITDVHGRITEVNGAFFAITGYSREEVIGQNPRIFNSGRHDEAFFTELWSEIITHGKWQGEIWNRRKNGQIFPQYISISSVLNDYQKVQYYVAVFSDISAQKQREAQLNHLALYDPLTNLPNRANLTTILDQEIRLAYRNHLQLAVIFIDVDLFKHINDSFGHLVGDEVLSELAQRLTGEFGAHDMLSRIGGDEFVVLLPHLNNSDEATLVVNRLKQVFDSSFNVSTGDKLRLSASMGISIYPNDGLDSDSLLRNADAAMHRAKQQGRNSYAFYTESLTRQSLEQLKLQNALHQAIVNEAFYLVYQPKVYIANANMAGFEALLRWDDPVLGLVSPAVFIPVAEQAGLIHDIGLWVLRQACLQGMAWLNEGRDFGRIAVNVAGPQLQRRDFVDEVCAVLPQTGLPAIHLELEVTESFMMKDPEAAINDLKRLGDLGIALSIDDFGTGYSSMNYLKKLPIHKLKIDQSFVRDIPADANNTAIAKAVIALGHALNLEIIAEGVETQEQADFLLASGCDQAQGYLYSKPKLPKDLIDFF